MNSRIIYGLVIFASAFLLFQVQPILGKMILPWFGGSAGVWIVCLLFFQVVLLMGYLYANLLTRMLRPRAQVSVHAALLFASLLVLPIVPEDSWKPPAPFHPAVHILWILGATIGLPYFLLSSTSPLLQAWYVQKDANASPYRLYAVSNIASMLALASYPVLVEPRLATSHQALVWSWGYAAAAMLCAAVALASSKQRRVGAQPEAPPSPEWTVQALWISLAACGSALLLAITHHLSQNIASVPLLWVIPLALYLLTFILCFEGRGWYRRDLFLRLLGVALGSMAYALAPSFAGLPISVLIPLYCSCLFVVCMFCHGELSGLKPHPAHLTSFYLMISIGGVIGALFVAVVAPWLFSGDYETRIVIGCCTLLALVVLYRDPSSPFYRSPLKPAWLLLVALAVALIGSLGETAREESKGSRLTVRNFYGVLRVVDQVAPSVVLVKGDATPPPQEDNRFEKLMNGTIDHGLQFCSPTRRDQPTTYYGPSSGVGLTLMAAGSSDPLNVGVVGLGVGTLAAYGRKGDRYKFYEINPLVVQLANQEFTFLRDSAANTDIIFGDGRLSLEQEPTQEFDVLVVDAFSGDSIPVHLLTREAFALYFRHLKPQGVLAIHISNQYLNLVPVVAASAFGLRKEVVVVENKPDSPRGIYRASWALVGSGEGFLGQPEVERAGIILPQSIPQLQWTDDYSSLLKVIR
jgi:hypothetical protein